MAQAQLKPEDVRYLVVHCSATPTKQDIGVKEIERMHRERGFLRIGYHFVIRRDGTVETGRELTAIGAHLQNHNHYSIGICMVGGVTPDLKPEDNFTLDQYHALAVLLQDLRTKFPKAVIQGHRDFPGVRKDCPCFDVKAWVKETLDAPEVTS